MTTAPFLTEMVLLFYPKASSNDKSVPADNDYTYLNLRIKTTSRFVQRNIFPETVKILKRKPKLKHLRYFGKYTEFRSIPVIRKQRQLKKEEPRGTI